MARPGMLLSLIVSALSISNATAQNAAPSSLLAIDQHRDTVVERIMVEWGDRLPAAGSGITREQLRAVLDGLRSDQLLAASLAGSLTGLRDVLAHALTPPAAVAPQRAQAKALGDAADDVVYTPVTPCRLVDTRTNFAAVYQNGGAFGAGEIRNYAAAGGNGVCLTQLPPGLNPSALQLQVFGIPHNGVSGDIEVLPQGATFGGTATLVFLNNVLITSASTTAPVNLANNQIGVQVRSGSAHVAIDVVGYFKAPVGTVGGTVVIDQNKALAGNVTPGDTPGFPVTISLPGSYVLGGNLIVPSANTNAIVIAADHVTIDLNGFAILGPTDCSGGLNPCANAGSGIGIGTDTFRFNITVRNGTVQGMGSTGVNLFGDSHLIEKMHARSNGSVGIQVIPTNDQGGSIIQHNMAERNGAFGISIGDGLVSDNLANVNGNGIGTFGFATVSHNVVTRNVDFGLFLDALNNATGGGNYFGNVVTNNGLQNVVPNVGTWVNQGQNACGAAACPGAQF